MAAKKEPERYCELADGTRIVADAGETGRDLWIMFRDDTGMKSAVTKLSKADACTRIVFRFPGGENVFEGYTEIITVKMDYMRKINVRLRRSGDVQI